MKIELSCLCLVILIGLSNAYGEQIPSWIKNNAKWWSENQITDDEFVKGMQYLIDNGMIQIPDTSQTSSDNSNIPSWIKNTASWWSNGALNDSDFLKAMQYLVQIHVIKIKQNNLVLSSPAFENSGTIPVDYTCDGNSTSPPLVISGVPKNAVSLVLMLEDPDAPHGIFVHWIVYNISPKITRFTKDDTSSLQGLNGANKLGYIGLCPPSGSHHYFFKLYALDKNLIFSNPPTKSDLEHAMVGHVLENTTLLGRYSRD